MHALTVLILIATPRRMLSAMARVQVALIQRPQGMHPEGDTRARLGDADAFMHVCLQVQMRTQSSRDA